MNLDNVEFWRLPRVLGKIGISRSGLYQKIAIGSFPKPVKLGAGKSVGFVSTEVESWIAARISERDRLA